MGERGRGTEGAGGRDNFRYGAGKGKGQGRGQLRSRGGGKEVKRWFEKERGLAGTGMLRSVKLQHAPSASSWLFTPTLTPVPVRAAEP